MLPKRIGVCPIIDTVVEVRFKSKIFPDAVFGLIYESLKATYPDIKKLPILDLPEKIRSLDPNLRNKPHYIATDGNYSIQIGPDVFVIGNQVPYNGWENYSKRIYSSLEAIFNIGIIERISRLGFRYVNFFEDDIFDGKVNVDLKIGNTNLSLSNTVIRTEINDSGFVNTLQIANNVTQKKQGKTFIGSIIDIDTYKIFDNTDFIKNYKTEINKAHEIEKKLFFSLLSDDFLKSLNPVY